MRRRTVPVTPPTPRENPPMPADRADHAGVSRISVSLPPSLLDELDGMVASRGYGSRSQAVSEMVQLELVEHKRKLGRDVMVGNITLHYDRTVPGLQRQLADLQFRYIDEVISSLHVQLSHQQVMEVILVQGQAQRLQTIADEMGTRRGVISGRLQLLAAIMPPIQLPGQAAAESGAGHGDAPRRKPPQKARDPREARETAPRRPRPRKAPAAPAAGRR